MLIIYAHPNHLGFSGFFLKKVKENLDEANVKYELLDLYQEKFDPVLKAEEHYTSGNKNISEQVQNFQKKITEAQKIIFIYPIWWQNVPAILKGFFDRVFTPRFAFSYEGKYPKGLLKGKKAVVFTHSAGPKFFTFFFAGNRGLKVAVKDTLRFCGIKTKGYLLGSAQKLNGKKEEEITKIVSKGLRFLNK